MPRHDIQGSMSAPPPSSPNVVNSEYSYPVEELENNIITNFMKTIVIFNEEINKSLRQIMENTNKHLEEISKLLKESKENINNLKIWINLLKKCKKKCS